MIGRNYSHVEFRTLAIRFEEADLISLHGDKYRIYRKQVPMMIPALGANSTQTRQAMAEKIASETDWCAPKGQITSGGRTHSKS